VEKRVAKRTSNNRSAFLAYGLLTLVVVVVVIGGIYAKYFYENDGGSGVVTAKDFYFTSDLLAEDNPLRTIVASGADASITFELRNYEDSLRWADDEIEYTVSVKEATAAQDSATVTHTGKIGKEKETDSVTVQDNVVITIPDLKVGKTYEVTAVGKAGYVKTLKATFVIVNEQKVYKELKTVGNQVILTVWTENVTGDAVFKIPADLIPNRTETENALDGVNNYNSIDNNYKVVERFEDNKSFTTAIRASQVYYFIKDDPSKTYKLEDFDISAADKLKVGGVEAIVGTP